MSTPIGVITLHSRCYYTPRALAVDAHLLVHHRDLKRQRGVRRRHEEVAQRRDLLSRRKTLMAALSAHSQRSALTTG